MSAAIISVRCVVFSCEGRWSSKLLSAAPSIPQETAQLFGMHQKAEKRQFKPQTPKEKLEFNRIGIMQVPSKSPPLPEHLVLCRRDLPLSPPRLPCAPRTNGCLTLSKFLEINDQTVHVFPELGGTHTHE